MRLPFLDIDCVLNSVASFRYYHWLGEERRNGNIQKSLR